MSAGQESARAIALETAGATDAATRVGDLTVRQFIELLTRTSEQPLVRRVPPGQGAVDGAIAEIRHLLGSLDEAFQRVQAAILSESRHQPPNQDPVEPSCAAQSRPVVRSRGSRNSVSPRSLTS